MTCTACGATTSESAAFCPACGAALKDAGEAATVYSPPTTSSRTTAPTRPPSQAATPGSRGGGSRFGPGVVLVGRYQIVGLLGRGGMGEVYRAEDLSLGQSVALKFLPDFVAADADRLARFRSEVSVARQVSHPNVCRVYDIGEADGHVFLSMEYVDGEDLASLLRRIGRLAPDKAAEMARQLCAGLAAAHDKGVLHRDLKPANVMIDGRGRVRLADFGLAGGDDVKTSGLAGTPAYMAPEQFSGQATSVKSDIYALGLVLYEMFTGKAAFSGATVNDLARQHREATPTSLTQVVAEIDPIVDRVIQRCLAKDPAERPASALAVSAALPGGDPLAAALAAGETPSPALVAASGGIGALQPVPAMLLFLGVIVALVPVVLLSQKTQAVQYLPLERSPEILADAAHQIVTRLGYTEPVTDAAWGFTPTDFLNYLQRTDQTPTRYERLRSGQPPGVTFWYRQSPLALSTDSFVAGGTVTLNNPSVRVAGMVNVMLDLKGRLHFLQAVPARVRDSDAPATAPDWGALLGEAGFDASKFTAATPTWVPPVFGDVRAAWTGAYPDRPDIPIRVEAAAWQGRPVYFQIFEPWSGTTLGVQGARPRVTAGAVFAFTLFCAVVIGAFFLARRNLRLDRGDEVGAFRLALVLCLMHVIAGLMTAHVTYDVVPTLLTVGLLIGRGLLLGMVVYAIYMALEPDVRRRWPETLVAWSRVLTGRLKDPLVGRDVLLGILVGVVHRLLIQLSQRTPAWLGEAPRVSVPFQGFDGSLQHTVSAILDSSAVAVLIATTLVLIFFLLFLVLRRRMLAVGAFGGLLIVAATFEVGWSPALGFVLAGIVVQTLTVTRLGLLALIVSLAASRQLEVIPLSIDPGEWAFSGTVTLIGLLLAAALYGFRTALAGRPLFDSRLLD
jgi:Protein kinase domain